MDSSLFQESCMGETREGTSVVKQKAPKYKGELERLLLIDLKKLESI